MKKKSLIEVLAKVIVGAGEGDSSRTHGIFDGHHDHELRGVWTIVLIHFN